MRNRFLGLTTALVLSAAAGSADAATIQLAPIGAGSAPTVISAPGAVSQSFTNVFTSTSDLYGATVSAEADDGGLLRVFADHGGDVDALFQSQASASASFSKVVTVAGPSTGPAQFTVQFGFDAIADTLTGQTGAAVGGFSSALLNVSADVGTFFNIFRAGQAPITGFTTARGSLQYVSEQFFTASSPSTIATVQSLSGIRSGSVFRNSPSLNAVQSDNDISISISRVSDFIVEGLIEIVFTAQVGDRMRLSADMTALANSAPGHIASMNAMNTGTMTVVVPEGFSLVPEDGIPLLNQVTQTAVVPLPPTIALMLAGLAGFGMLRPWRKAALSAMAKMSAVSAAGTAPAAEAGLQS